MPCFSRAETDPIIKYMREEYPMNWDYLTWERILAVVIPLAVFLLTFLLGMVFRSLLFRRLAAWSAKTESKVDDVLVGTVRSPFVIWSAMLGLYIAVRVSHIPVQWAGLIQTALSVLGMASVVLVLANAFSRLVASYGDKMQAALPVTSLTQSIGRILIIGIGVLMILNRLGISIAPVLAALGVGGLAVALALQDTLANLFAGFYISIARQIKVGDYIMLESGQDGCVNDINWRTTKIRMLNNNMILIPNAKLIQSIVTNYSLPTKDLVVKIEAGVHYNSDLDHVERIAAEVGKEVMMESKSGVPEFTPSVRFHTFGDSQISFTTVLRCRDFTEQWIVKHEFIKRLHKRFAKEGIVIPYPIRAINTTQEGAAAAQLPRADIR